MKIIIDQADRSFSQWIRLRDKECVRCHSKVRYNKEGLPNSHENSHYHGRGKETTRFEPDNCDTLCFACHKIWGSDDKEGYKQFKIKQLGQRRFDSLMIQANTTGKRDRLLQAMAWKQMVKEALQNQ